MRTIFKSRKGFTLIELVVVIALFSFVMMVAFSVLSFGFRGFSIETDNVDNQSKVRHAISSVFKEIRRVDATDIIISGSKIDVDGVIYVLQGNTLLKNGNELVSGIKSFSPSKVGNKVTLKVTSQANHGREFTLISEIYVRE